MSTYFLVRAVHIIGAVMMFVALGVEFAVLRGLALARTIDQLRSTLAVIRVNAVIGPLAALLIVVPGIYMATTAWGWASWIGLSFWALILLIAIGGIVTGRQIRALERGLQANRPDTEEQRVRRVSLLWSSFVVRACLLFAIVTVMATKPSAPLAALILSGSLVLGIAGRLVFRRGSSRRLQEERA